MQLPEKLDSHYYDVTLRTTINQLIDYLKDREAAQRDESFVSGMLLNGSKHDFHSETEEMMFNAKQIQYKWREIVGDWGEDVLLISFNSKTEAEQAREALLKLKK